LFGLRQEGQHALARQPLERDRLQLERARVGLEPGHLQQLRDQMHRALDAGLQVVERHRLARGLRLLCQLDLQLDRGQRRVELVRDIGQEGALRRQQPVDLGQQLVQRVDQRLHFVGHLVRRQRAQQRDIARADLVAQAAQRLQRAADGRADQEAQQQQQQRQRRQQAGYIFKEGVPAALGRVGDLDHALAVVQRVGAPARAVPFDLMQAGLLQRRAGVGQRGIDQPAIAGPDLAHELAIVLGLFLAGFGRDLLIARRSRLRIGLVGQPVLGVMAHDRIGDLFEPVVAQRVEAAPGHLVGQRAGQQAAQQQRADQPDQQARVDRVHGAGRAAEASTSL
jgi:hypothetical protein